MDLHVVAPLASPVERDAVDAVLSPRIGPPRSGWQGGVRDMAVDGHIAHGGHEARSHRDLLLPALHGVQSRIGFISQPALAYICRRLTVPPAEAYGVATFYALFATSPRPPVVAHVCDDIACRLSGAEELCEALERSLGRPGAPVLDERPLQRESIGIRNASKPSDFDRAHPYAASGSQFSSACFRCDMNSSATAPSISR